MAYLKSTNGSSIHDLVKGCISDLKKFAGDARQSDDITVLTLRYLGNGRV
jgi:serine phosphatase RsbU (regulator of sigma subunit)